MSDQSEKPDCHEALDWDALDFKAMSPERCIRFFCYDCMGRGKDARALIKDCPSRRCPLWNRRGFPPIVKVDMTEEQKQAASERLAAYRAAKAKGE